MISPAGHVPRVLCFRKFIALFTLLHVDSTPISLIHGFIPMVYLRRFNTNTCRRTNEESTQRKCWYLAEKYLPARSLALAVGLS